MTRWIVWSVSWCCRCCCDGRAWKNHVGTNLGDGTIFQLYSLVCQRFTDPFEEKQGVEERWIFKRQRYSLSPHSGRIIQRRFGKTNHEESSFACLHGTATGTTSTTRSYPEHGLFVGWNHVWNWVLGLCVSIYPNIPTSTTRERFQQCTNDADYFGKVSSPLSGVARPRAGSILIPFCAPQVWMLENWPWRLRKQQRMRNLMEMWTKW